MMLELRSNDIDDAGAAALAAFLGRGALPSLQELDLCENMIGDQGLIALAVPLRWHPALATLKLHSNEIGDKGLAALVAPPRWPSR